MKKLTRRERALIQHAKRKAVQSFKETERLVVRAGGRVIRDYSLECSENFAKLNGTHEAGKIIIDLSDPWRPAATAPSAGAGAAISGS